MMQALRKWVYFYPPIHICWLLLLVLPPPTLSYLLIVPDDTSPGRVIFNASLPTLGRSRFYTLNIHKNGFFVKKLIGIHARTGQVYVKEKLDCRGVWYPNLFTMHVDSFLEYEKGWKRRSTRSHDWGWTRAVRKNSEWPRVWREAEADMMELRDGRNKGRDRGLVGVQYYSMPLRVFITGEECSRDTVHKPFLAEDDYHGSRTSLRISEARKWVSESFASFALPSDSEFTRICLKGSQFVNSIAAFLPSTILSESCEVKYLDVNDPRFTVETSVGDLVAAYDMCIVEPLWKIIILLEFTCYGDSGLVSSMEHRLKIVYHHEQLNDTDIAHRVRRELKNQSPYFDQALYTAMVTEEKPPGVVVVTLRARDPENSPVTYSMTSLLDSRSQSMFTIDESSGIVTTQSKLDRELVDVHYFRVTATDNDFPPRSGTTTLQINVIDANDHSPVFENEAYEASIREGVAIGTIVITVRATDQDVYRNSEIEYSFAEPLEAFHMDGKTGVVSTRLALDRETVPSYTLALVATDNAPAGERRTATAALRIKVVDDNDNYPQFTERTYTVTVPEDFDVAGNPLIATVKATDADEGPNAAIRYAIIGGNMQAQFSIDSLTGDVFLAKPLDYEVLRSYRLVIRAQDGGSPSGRSNTTQLLVNVKDVNDNSPRFYSSLFQESVLESVPPGYSIVRVQAYDADEGSNSALKYSLSSRDEAGTSTSELPITIDTSTGWITTTRQLDREGTSKYQFHVLVEDAGVPVKTATASVLINVQDVNDNDPMFNPKIYEVVVSEQDPPGTLVTTVSATDPDENPRLHYEITNGNVRGRFSMTSQNNRGLVTVSQPLDYRQEKRFILTVTATDSGGRSDIATVYVNVSDANNYSPVFENAPYSAQVFEDAPIGTTVLVVQASDSDVGQNAQITYTLGSNSEQSSTSFSINSQTGAILTTKLLDRESVASYLLTVTARDGGVPSQSDTTDVEITVQDVNDNSPVFSSPSYTGAVSEDALVGTSVLQVQATDVDMGLNGKLRYSLTPPNSDASVENSFVMDASSGVIRTSKTLDRESVAQYSLLVYAIDRGSPALSSSVSVIIRIDDVNDSPPAFESEKLVMYIAENSPIGSTVGEMRARDPDEGQNAVVEYSIIGGEDSTSFSLVTRPGWDKAELLTMVELDYESPRKRFELVVRAASPPLRSDVRIEILVTDVNDNAPALKDFQVVFNNFRDCFPSGVIGMIPAFDADVSDQLHYRILSGNNANLVLVNETTGEISLSPQLNTNVPKLASMEISVTDGVNEVKATMTLSVRLITEDMLFSSVTVRLADMTEKAFLSPLLGFFVDALAAIIPCPREFVYLFSIQDDTDVDGKILNVSFSARRPDVTGEEFYTPQYLQERVYLNRAILARLSTVQVLPFDDNLCVREPCLNFEQCLTVLKFGNASGFISSDTVLFRPIYPVSTFACRCPPGFTGSREHYLCDTEVDLCYSNPCINGGSCLRREGGYSCVCEQGFTGVNCEIDLNLDTCQPGICNKGLCAPLVKGGGFQCHCHGNEAYGQSPSTQRKPRPPLAQSDHNDLCQLRARGFSKSSFLTFPALRQRHRLHLRFRFATQSENGLLLYNGRYNEKHDFIALEVVRGRVQLSFSLGSNVTRTVASIPGGVSDGAWHTVQVSYFNKTATLSLDDCDTQLALKKGSELGPRWSCANITTQTLSPRCALFTETCHRFLDLTGPLQLGGLPSLPTDFQVQSKDYEGCIADVYVDHKFLDLNSFVADNGTHPGCHHKKNFCSSNPCKNGGKCREAWGTYMCQCKDGYGGKDCSQGLNPSWRFHGDGILSFNPLLKPIQLPWINSLSVRTLQKDAFLMNIQVGQNSSATMSLKNGLLEYSYNHEVVRLRQGLVSDGRWHHVEAKWMSTEVWLSLDYGQREVTQTLNGKVQGLYVGKILIGGPDPSYASLNSDFGYFQGCVQDVRVGSRQSSLQRPTVEDNVSEGCSSQSQCSMPQTKCPAHADCLDQWERSTCECHAGWVGSRCSDVCQFDPCDNLGRCDREPSSPKGYRCACNSDEYSGEYCQNKIDQPCPSSWWGYPVCGPCECNVELGYNPDCNKTTGQCYCKENHYQPGDGVDWKRCLPCDCYTVGSVTAKCDYLTGQCQCRPGVIGRRCDSCSNRYAEVTTQGCQVVYDGCPRSFGAGLWWDRTNFGESAIANCPQGSSGRASRLCDGQLSSWSAPDLFNCTSHRFSDLRKVLSQLESGDLLMNTFVAIKVAADLNRATNLTTDLYGADVVITQQLIHRLVQYELKLSGLNLTHSQDKDYIQNLVAPCGVILDMKYFEHWRRILDLTEMGPVDLVLIMEKYLMVLTTSQGDTYTNPFEIITSNMVLGLDVVTSTSLFGFEGTNSEVLNPDKTKVVLPDTSQFLHPSIEIKGGSGSRTVDASPTISFPKYNNYLQDRRNFDPHSRIMVPLDLLGIKHLKPGDIGDSKAAESRAVWSYAVYREAGDLFPPYYDETVTQRWGIQLKVGSAIVSCDVLVPVAVPTQYDDSNELYEVVEHKSLSQMHLTSPIRLRLWIDSVKQPIRSSPQCVHWKMVNGKGEWSRSGCHTELPEDHNHLEPYLVNCTCYHLSTFAVLLDVVDLEYIPEPTFLEELVTYIGFSISLSLLLAALLILSCIRGKATNSNSIHKNIVFCLFLGEAIYFIALKLRRELLEHEFPCKMIAMFLHYFWLSSFSWTLVDSLHLNRMLTELRDINHGQMRFYYCLGYGLPAIIVGLSVGVRADQYGNFYFCWLSIYESVVWSLVGPVCLSVAVTLVTLMLSVRTAFTLKDHVLGYGNLRTLVWVSVVFLPLLGIVWVLLVLAVSEPLPLLPPALSLAVIIQSAFTLAGFCFVNARVRRNLYVSCLKCMGREIPKDLDLSVDAIGSSSNIGGDRPGATRSALAYRNSEGVSMGVARRNMGISTSSTTSRSTAKTSSSPYRSDTQLRGASNTDTSTSNYNSTSELPSFMRGYSAHGKIKEEGSRQSDSDSDNSVDGRSLELASSHSSDDDESSRQHRSITGGSTVAPTYLPNICETGVPAPPTLNVISQSELFPNLAPLYAPRWSSQIPATYLPSNLGDLREEETSPQPLPRPDLDPHQDYPSDPHKLAALESPNYETNLDRTYHVNHMNLATVYEHDGHKMDNYNTDLSEYEEKVHVTDKYLFPYTAEEDHCPVPTLPASNRLVSRERESPGTPESIRSRDSPVYSAAPSYRNSPNIYSTSHRDSPLHYSHRDNGQYGHSLMRASPLLSHRSSANHTPLLIQGHGMDPEPNISETEKDMSETPV